MPLNPLQFTEQVVADFLRYLVTAHPLADERLSAQLGAHLALGQTRRSPLVRGPYAAAYAGLSGKTLSKLDWREELFGHLTANALGHAAAEVLGKPLALEKLVERLSEAANRAVRERDGRA